LGPYQTPNLTKTVFYFDSQEFLEDGKESSYEEFKEDEIFEGECAFSKDMTLEKLWWPIEVLHNINSLHSNKNACGKRKTRTVLDELEVNMGEGFFSREGSKELLRSSLSTTNREPPPPLPNPLTVGLGRAKAVLALGWARAALASPRGQVPMGWRALESHLVLPPRRAPASATKS
jgi:hypothetical protein